MVQLEIIKVMEIEDFKKAEQLVRNIDFITQDLDKINVPFDKKGIYVSISFDNQRSIEPREETVVKMIDVLKNDLESELQDMYNQLEKI